MPIKAAIPPSARVIAHQRHARQQEDRDMDVGFIGLGHMGAPMALNLLKAGHRITVFNRTRSKAEALAAKGAQVADRVADACRGDALITMLSDDPAVEDVVFGDGGALSALRRNAIHISMSTISVALSDRLAEVHGKAGQGYVAAPVFGRPEAAAAAKLFIVAAGADTTVARCQPLFNAMGQKTFVIGGKPSEANLVKLTGNFLIASALESLGEAFALVRKSGLDPHRYLDILTGSLFSAPVYKTYGPIIADERIPADGFKMSLALKDMRLALAAADAQTVPMPVASLVRDHLLEGVAQGEGDTDWSGLARLCARSAGLHTRGAGA
jgi:3-hydroxyisobutyrate dehydrogenase-like beta-hydroxyacid dehydrogenase